VNTIRNTVRVSFQILLGVALIGALAGAILSVAAPDIHVMWGDADFDGSAGIALAALAGSVAALVVALVFAVLIAVFGVVLPAVLIVLLLMLAAVIVALVISAVGGVALACAPFLMVGFGCVLLLRALVRRVNPAMPHH
jgi:hypothetical protein